MILLNDPSIDVENIIADWRNWSELATKCFPEFWHPSLWDHFATKGMQYNKDFDKEDLDAIEYLAKKGGMLIIGQKGILEWAAPKVI